MGFFTDNGPDGRGDLYGISVNTQRVGGKDFLNNLVETW